MQILSSTLIGGRGRLGNVRSRHSVPNGAPQSSFSHGTRCRELGSPLDTMTRNGFSIVHRCGCAPSSTMHCAHLWELADGTLQWRCELCS
jgi:hypothetical protein